MPDYEALYHRSFHATENAINALIAAQRECEELYIAAQENEESADGTP